MDIATIIGLLAGLGVVGAAIFLGGDFMSFVDISSMMIVIGGAISATVLRFTLGQVAVAFMQREHRLIAFVVAQDELCPNDLRAFAREDRFEGEASVAGPNAVIPGLIADLVKGRDSK